MGPKAVRTGVAVLWVAWPALAGAVPVVWTGSGDGSSWGSAANWNPAVVPDNGSTTYEVSIGGTPAVNVNGVFQINSLSLASGASLAIGEGRFLGFNADSTNDGTIRLQDDGVSGNATLRFEGTVRLAGAGRVLFDSPHVNQFGPLSGSHVLTVGAQQTVGTSGPDTRGSISGQIVNEGTIDANGGRIDLSGANKTNLGLIRARDGGSLVFSSFTLANLGGLIDLDAASALTLDAARVNGGVIGGSGRLLSGYPAELQDVVLGGVTAEIRDNQFLDIWPGTLTNDGTIRLLDDPAVAGLVAAFRTHGAVLLDGAGSLVFASNGSNHISGFSSSTLTIGTHQTITTTPGALGSIASELLNQGTIEANGGSLAISGANKTNRGVLRARNGGTLTLSSLTLANEAGGRFDLSDLSSTLILDDARITGGLIQGSGILRPGYPGELQDVALSGVTAEIRDNQFLDIWPGTLTNDGTIRLLDDPAISGLVAAFRTHGAVLLDGSGSLVFASNGNNQISGFSGSVLSIGPDQTVTTTQGALGTISSSVVNQGTIEADAGSLTLSGANKTNAGLLRARNGGALTLASLALENSGAMIALTGGGSLNLDNARINGGLIQGSGILRPGYPGELQDVALSGVTAEIRDNQFLDIWPGTLTNDGTIRLLDDPAISGLVAAFRTHGAVLLDGSGSLVFASNGSNHISGFSGATLEIGSDQVIRTDGPGTSGAIGLPFTSQGTIDADGGLLALNAPATSDGLMQAQRGGVLHVDANVGGTGRWNATGGLLRIAASRSVTTSGDVLVFADGELELLGPRMTGATFLVDAGGVLDVDGTLAATAGLDVRLVDPADWQWGPAAGLEIANASAAPPGPWQGWAFIEVGGADTGPGGMFANQNLWLPRLVVGPQGRVFLSDEIDNGQRGAGGEPEALYVGSLVFSDATGLLDLNGLHLYYQSLTGSPAQIIDVAVPPDRDRDGIENALDSCPYWASADQADLDGNGIGNVCECGDQNEDGRVDVRDLVAINLAIFGVVPISPLCDTNNDGRCDVSDILGANYKIFGRPALCSRYPLPPP